MRAVLTLVLFAACGRMGFDPFGGGAGGDAAGANDAWTGDAMLPGNLAFVTSTLHPLSSIGGVQNADAICNMRATEANLPGTYVAWLSSATSNARDRIGTTARGWRRMDGRPFADTLAEIAINKTAYPIIFEENGQRLAGATIGTGTLYTGNYENQGDWAN